MLHSSVIWLLPIVFIAHDFEEIMMMDAWMKRNKNFLQNKFPRIGKRIISTYENLSTASFSLAVAEEFLILVLAVILAVEFNILWLWVACFMAFSLHLVIHIVQWLVIRKYIPAIITSMLSLVYSIIAFKHLISIGLYSNTELFMITLSGLFIMVINLTFMHKMAAYFETFLIKYARTK